MDWQLLALSFGTIFVSELGDKSQLATLSLSGNSKAPRRYIFLGSALALLAASLIGVLLGGQVSQFLPTRLLKAIAAFVFAIVAIRLLSSHPET